MDYIEISAKTLNNAIIDACQQLGITSEKLEYTVISEGSSGFLGFNAKPFVIHAKSKSTVLDQAKIFLYEVFAAMNMIVTVDIKMNEDNNTLNIDLSGDEMGILIGKRGQTLDAIQYLTSLVINKGVEDFVRVKIDTENYRKRRRDTLENLARNISYKVKRTKKSITLEPMNPYERRIIHSSLQGDKSISTYSEGDEPYRKVVIAPKR
ncbi:MAG: RNA-binding cell elongation regulator Jag/EloR [Eubacteriales bacterium]